MRRVCFLTGAGGRLGTAFCRAFAGRYQIVGLYRRRGPEGAAIHGIQADVADAAALEAAVDEALRLFGRIDLVVNNAVQYTLAPALDAKTLGSLERQWAVNVAAPLRLVALVEQRFWRGRAEENARERRNVVNVSSLSGQNVYAGRGQAVYSATKAALDMLTRHLAAELGPLGVRANAVAPNSFPRIVKSEAVAAAVAALDEGSETGLIVPVDRA